MIGKGAESVADDRQSAETPAPADPAADSSDKRAGDGSADARQPAVPEQPTRATAAPSTSRHDRDVAAANTARPWRGRFSKALSRSKSALNVVRTRVAAAIWMAAVLAAIALSLGALLVALKANEDNTLVSALLDVDKAIDGPFWKVFDFYKETKSGAQGPPDEVKNHLVNWGLAAAGYLIVGRLLDRLIRPGQQ
jgi:hypothetical protein